MVFNSKNPLNLAIGYVIFNESIWDTLIKRQVVDIITSIKNTIAEKEFYLINFLSWRVFYKERKKIKHEIMFFKEYGIKLKIIPIPLPIPRYNFKEGWKLNISNNVFLFIIIIVSSLPAIIYFKIFKNVSLFHCRSYAAAIPVLLLKIIFPNILFIFDPRSDLPEEIAFKENWDNNNKMYRIWKHIESCICKHSDIVIAIGEVFRDKLQIICENKSKVLIVYNNVDTRKFIYNKYFRNEYREHNNLNNRTIFCYSGSLSNNSWNNPDLYSKFIVAFCNKYSHLNPAFLFLIEKYYERDLYKSLQRHNIDMRFYRVENPNIDDVYKYVSVADFGMYFLPYYSPRVGTKFVEFCSVGIPVIVNDNVGGAVYLIEKYGLGVSLGRLELNNYLNCLEDGEIGKIELFLGDKDKYREICRDYAVKCFSNEVVVKQYSEIYRRLIK